jgi:L-lactate dehydrogenase complex protein LldG
VDEQAFLTRVRQAVGRTAPHFGALMNDHIKAMSRHDAADAHSTSPEPAGEPPAPGHLLGEMLGLPAPDDRVGLAEHWVREFTSLGGQADVAHSPDAGTAAIVSKVERLIAQRGGFCIVTTHPLLEEWGVAAALRAKGIRTEVYASAADREQLALASVGVTVASAAIAETGTLLIESNTGQGRYSSLLAPVHVGVIPPGEIYPGVAGWLASRGARYRSGENLPSSAVFATGPSRSADIAGDLALGVHGPGEVHAVVTLW